MARRSASRIIKSAADFLPSRRTLDALRKAAASCEGCELYKKATQTVFGEGSNESPIVFVGEQPGDAEDRAGHPFVGPAGRLFDKALAEIKLSRDKVYITNAVKHFKWEPMGKRRKHVRPLASEVAACRPWLSEEVELIEPKILVCMGVTAAQSVLGRTVRLTQERGRFFESRWSEATLVTIHPSAIYRFPAEQDREEEYERFVAELKLVRKKLAEFDVSV